MAAISPRVIEEFCKLCDWSYQVWGNHRALFDDNERSVELQKSFAADALRRLNTISREYSLLQISKLHDRAVVAGEVTLGIDYVVKYGGWNRLTASKLAALAATLNDFAKELRSVRNKVLSHNDLAAVLSGEMLGEFKANDDIKYFEVLQEFVNLVHCEIIGGPYPFDDLFKNDVVAFMSNIKP